MLLKWDPPSEGKPTFPCLYYVVGFILMVSVLAAL